MKIIHEKAEELKNKLKTAFKAIRKRNILARPNFYCCQGCGIEALSQEFELEKNSDKIGYVFYHRQDKDSLKERGELYLAFGSNNDDDLRCKEVGNIILHECLRVGIIAEWNGEVQNRIFCHL
jgi:hypothetical protein